MPKTIFVVLVSVMTLIHFLKNAKHYSTKNKLVLPIIYATSLVLLWHLNPLIFVFTTVKVVFFGDHVSQTKFNYYGTKNAPLYIVAHDVLAFLGALVASRLQ
jgi:uncharacterized membrane protein YkvI